MGQTNRAEVSDIANALIYVTGRGPQEVARRFQRQPQLSGVKRFARSMLDGSGTPTRSWCSEEWYHGVDTSKAMSLTQFIARTSGTASASSNTQNVTLQDALEAFTANDDPGSAVVPELPGLGSQEEVISFRILRNRYKDHAAGPLIKKLYDENSQERAQALAQLKAIVNTGQLGFGWFCWAVPQLTTPRSPASQVLKEIESKTLTAGVIADDATKLYFTDPEPVLTVVKDISHCAPTKVYPGDKDFLHRLGLSSLGLDYIKDGVLGRILTGIQERIRTNGHAAGAMNRDLYTNKTNGLQKFLQTPYGYKVNEKAQSDGNHRFAHVGYVPPYFGLALQIACQTYCLTDEVVQNGPIPLLGTYEEAEASGMARPPNYDASPGPLLEKHYKTNAEYFAAEGPQALKEINALLDGFRNEVYVHEWVKNNRLNNMEPIIQSWAQKADVYKRQNFFKKIRRYNRSDVRLSTALGLFSRALKIGQAHLFSTEAEQRQDQVDGALPGIVGNYSMMKGGHLSLVRFLQETQDNVRKGFNMLLGWMAPDVEAFDRQVPSEMALVMVPAFLLVRGWTADEVKRGLKFLYQEEQDGDGNIRFVPASRGRNIPPKWWTKHHDPADTRRSWDAFVTDQLVLQVVAVNLFSAPQATFLKRIARPLHGMSSGPQLHSDTCQLVVAMIMALARQAAEGDGNLQFTAKQYIDTAEALGFSFKDTPVEIPHFDQLSFNNFELVQWPEVADLVGSVLDGVPTPGDPIRSFGRYFLRYQPENLGSMMTYPKDCKCDVRTARHARSIAALVLGGILNPYSREALVAMCRTYADYGNQEEIFDEELLYELERWGLDFTDGDLANFFKNPTIENYLHLVLPGGPWSSVQLPLTVRETSRLFRKSADPAVQG
ncbi:MNN10, partial [Symbiodinium sp. KB8]